MHDLFREIQLVSILKNSKLKTLNIIRWTSIPLIYQNFHYIIVYIKQFNEKYLKLNTFFPDILKKILIKFRNRVMNTFAPRIERNKTLLEVRQQNLLIFLRRLSTSVVIQKRMPK